MRLYSVGMATPPSDPCVTGICGADVPPLVGSVLTGTGLTLSQAAQALEAGESPPLSDVQRRLVERWIEQQIGRTSSDTVPSPAA